MAEIRYLHGADIHQKVANPNTVSFLEGLLERARSGEIIGVAVAVLHDDFTASSAVVGGVGGYSMLGALEMIRHDLVEVNRGDDF